MTQLPIMRPTGGQPGDQPTRRTTVAALTLVPISGLLLQESAQAQQKGQDRGSWSGDLALTIKGRGQFEVPVAGIPGGKARVVWSVDRSARGRVVLDRSFGGSGLARMPDSNNQQRYESWAANTRQTLEMTVNDSATYYGYIAPQRISLDETDYHCPEPDDRHPTGLLRSSVLLFDRAEGTYIWERPRMTHRCATRIRRNPKHGPADWTARAPFDLLSNSHELEFDIFFGLWPLEASYRWSGPCTEGAREVVLSRKIDLHWGNPFERDKHPAPVLANLELVLRKSG